MTKADQNVSHSRGTVSVLFQRFQMHAESNGLRSHLNNKQTTHIFDFPHLHRRVPIKNFVVAHEHVRLSI